MRQGVSDGHSGPTRSWWRKALFGIVTVALLMALLEGALWVAGAPRGGSNDPFVGFASAIPHFERDGDTVTRAEARRTVMNPFEFAAEKPAGTLRVICVGGSTTYGRPFFDETSFAGFLRTALPLADATREYDVVNAGAISYASYRVTGVMREAARFDPDVFVIYTGHNEFLEHRTYAEIRKLPAWLRTASGLVSKTRTGTFVRNTLAAAADGPEGVGEEVKRIPANAIGPDAFHRDDAWRARVVAEFRRALHAMIDISESAGARAVLVVPAANIADWSPWGSQASDALAVEDVGRFLAQLDATRRALVQGDVAAAEDAARACTEMDPRHAEAWFLLGQALRGQGRGDEAAGALRRALEEDVVPLRAIAALRDVVREVGAARGAIVVDSEPLLEPRPEAGVAGDDWFSDHVHPWPEVNALLAVAITEALVADGVLPAGAWNRDDALAATAARLEATDPAPRARELFRLAFVLGSFDRIPQARDRCERAVTLLEGGAAALAESARVLTSCDDIEGALEFARRAVATDDTSFVAHTRLGVVLLADGQPGVAGRELERAIELNRDAVEARAQLGALLAGQGDFAGAEEHFREVVRLRPNMADSHYNLGLALARRGRRAEAESSFRQALRIDPDHADAKKQLDALLR